MIIIVVIMITFNHKSFKDAQRCLAKPTCLVHSRWLTDLLFVSLYVDNWLNIILEIYRTSGWCGFFLWGLWPRGLVLCFISRSAEGRFWQRCSSSLPGPECYTASDAVERGTEHMPDRTPERLPDKMSEHMSDIMPEKMSERMAEKMPDRMPERMCDILGSAIAPCGLTRTHTHTHVQWPPPSLQVAYGSWRCRQWSGDFHSFFHVR